MDFLGNHQPASVAAASKHVQLSPPAISSSSLRRLMKLIPANQTLFFLFSPNLKVLLRPSGSLRAGGGFITISSRNGFHISPAVAWAHRGGNCRSSAESDSSVWGHDDTRIKFHPANCESVCFCACRLGFGRQRLSRALEFQAQLLRFGQDRVADQI